MTFTFKWNDMSAKFFVIPMALALCFSSPLMAKDHPNKGKGKFNSNKQSSPYSSQGRERAEERHKSKKQKKFKEKHHKGRDDYQPHRRRYDDEQERYRRQYEEERNGLDRRVDRYPYPQNPVDVVIDRKVNDAKSVVDDMHRRVIRGIDDRTRDLQRR